MLSTPEAGQGRRTTMGPIEAEMRARYLEARDRLNVPRQQPPKIVREHVPAVSDAPPRVALPPPRGPVVDLLSPPSWRVLLALVALKHRRSPGELIGQDRSRPVVEARFDAIALIHAHIEMSLPALGKKFGGRDHTTILHALRKRGVQAEPNAPFWTPEKDAEVARLWALGWSLKRIGEAIGRRPDGQPCTVAMVYQRVCKLALPHRSGKERKVRDPVTFNAKRRAQRKAARSAVPPGMTPRVCLERYMAWKRGEPLA